MDSTTPVPPPGPEYTRPLLSRPVLAVWLLTGSLYPTVAWNADRRAPPGMVFVGNISSHEDISNYLGHAEQASTGEVLFRNKLSPEPHRPALLNLEWLAVGWLSAALGNAPQVAFRTLGVVATLVLIRLTEAWLMAGGLSARSRFGALLLVFSGGGLGGWLLVAGVADSVAPYDLLAGFYPFLMTLTNPHFVAGAALASGALLALSRDRVGLGVALTIGLAFVRPYDAILVPAVDALAVVSSRPIAQWGRRLAPWMALAPATGYNLWLFLAHPAYSVFSYGGARRLALAVPSALEVVAAFGPAAVIAAASFVRAHPATDRPRRYLALWAAVAVSVVAIHPVSFALQFGVGVGVPLLSLAALTLARCGAAALGAATLLLSSSLIVAFSSFWVGHDGYYVPESHVRLSRGLAGVCRPGERLLAPQEFGYLAEAHAACSLYLPYSLMPGFPEKQDAVARFYAGSTPAERVRFLEEQCIHHVALLAQPGAADSWLGDDSPFATSATAPGARILSRLRPCASRGR